MNMRWLVFVLAGICRFLVNFRADYGQRHMFFVDDAQHGYVVISYKFFDFVCNNIEINRS